MEQWCRWTRVPMVSVVLWTTGLSLLGCHYRPVGAVTRLDDRCLIVPMVQNDTSFVDIEGPLTVALRSRLSAVGARVVTGTSSCDTTYRMEIAVVRISGAPRGQIVLDDDRMWAGDVMWQMDAVVKVWGHDNALVYGPDVVSVSDIAPVPPRLKGELALGQQVRQDLGDALAEELSCIVYELK